MNMIIAGHALIEMKKMAPNDIDCIITDPPFVSLEFPNNVLQYWAKFQRIFNEMERLTDRISVSILPDRRWHLESMMKMTDDVNIEDAFERPPKKGAHNALFLTRNQINDFGERGNWNIPKSSHIHARDVNKMAIIVKAMTNEGDTVLDPFCGSAAIGAACILLGRNYIGIEYDKERVLDGRQRLKHAEQLLGE